MSSRYECQSAFLIIDSHQIDFFVVQIILACHLLPAVAIAKVMLQTRVCFVVWITNSRILSTHCSGVSSLVVCM